MFTAALAKLPVMLPFALATIVGGIDCTESAAAAGDEYDTRAILLTEGVASLLAGLLGGVIQTTPYIGHPAYKKMGGRAAYTLATALFIGAVGYFGGFALLFQWLPKAAMFPILVFVGLEITAQSFQATPTRHYPALALAVLPALAYLASVPLNMALGGRDPDPFSLTMVQTLRCLANGFLISGMLWAAALAMLLDGRLQAAAGFLGVGGGLRLLRRHPFAAGRSSRSAGRMYVLGHGGARRRSRTRCSARRRTTGRRPMPSAPCACWGWRWSRRIRHKGTKRRRIERPTTRLPGLCR